VSVKTNSATVKFIMNIRDLGDQEQIEVDELERMRDGLNETHTDREEEEKESWVSVPDQTKPGRFGLLQLQVSLLFYNFYLYFSNFF